MSNSPDITLYTAPTPNGFKVSIALEELKEAGVKLTYDVKNLKFSESEQKQPAFLAINPNGRIPAMVDHKNEEGDFSVFESAAMILYIAERYDKDGHFWFPNSANLQSELVQWIFFIQGGVGPMQGQANHFHRYAPEKIPYAVNRYQNETKRLYGVYEERLQKRDWLVGDKYSYAEMCTYPWVRAGGWAGIENVSTDFPKLHAWCERIKARPAVQRGLQIPEGDTIAKFERDPSIAEAHAKAASAWIMKKD